VSVCRFIVAGAAAGFAVKEPSVQRRTASSDWQNTQYFRTRNPLQAARIGRRRFG